MPCPLDRRQEVAIDRDAISDTPDVASIFSSGHGFSRAASVRSQSALAAEEVGSRSLNRRSFVGRGFNRGNCQARKKGL